MQNTILWDISFLASINKNTDIVRNNQTNQLMLRRVTDIQSFPVMQALTLIRHQNLMAVYDVRILNGACVSLCEFINGVTLEQQIEQNGLFDLETAKRVLCQVCDGLSALHEHGIVHRDIKPSNIMTDAYGTVKIIDYDITRLIKVHQNRDTTIMGTEGYASPEQFGFAQTGAKADIYSCGVLLNYLLTGKLPNEQLYQGAAASVIAQCIEIDENKRFDSAEELKLVLMGKKRNKKRTWRPLPGFRGPHVFPKILTVFFMICWFFLLMLYITGWKMFQEAGTLRGQLVFGSVILLLWSAIPYFLFGDIFRMSEKISPNNPQNGKTILRILGGISFAAGAVILFFTDLPNL